MKTYKLSECTKLNAFKQVGAKELEDLIDLNGDVALLPSSKDYGLKTTLEKAKKLICEGEVFTVGRARYANIKYCNGKFVSSNNIIVESSKKEILTKFLYYFCYHNSKKFYSDSTTYPKFDLFLFNNLEIKVPNTADQINAIKKLDTIFQCKEIKLKQILNINMLIDSKFNEMFNSITLFEKLDNLTTKITDGSHNPPKGIESSEYVMLSSQNIFDDLNLDDVRFLSKDDFEKENRRTDIKEGDVLLTIVGSVGRTHVVRSGELFVFQRSVGVIKPKHEKLNSYFLSTFLNTDYAKQQLEVGAHGSSQKGIYLNDLKKLLIPCPDIGTQEAFSEYCLKCNDIKKKLKSEIKELDNLLEKIMDDYFTN